MASTIDLPLRRNKTMIWDGVAQKRVSGVWSNIDLTGATIRLIVRREIGDTTPLFTITSGSPTTDGSITIDPDQVLNRGEYVMRVEAAATDDEAEFPDDEVAYYPYEIEVTEGTGEVTTLASGDFKYAPDVR